MLGRTNTGGGGVGGLNFQVIGSTTAPNNPKENTIWIETDTNVTSWIFSAVEPSAPSEGMVWISTGTQSGVAFNALKKNGVHVYPLSAKQYVNGAWVDKTAKTYQNGEWVDWVYYIVRSGVMTRDLSVMGKPWDSGTYDGGNNTTITERNGYLSVKGSNQGYGAAYTEEDLTGKQSITIEGDFPVNEYSLLAVWSSVGPYITSNIVASVRLGSTGATLDISGLSGEMLVGITTVYTNEWKIVNMYMG